jgi:unsaturated rhamnogalacturonyl hydrolase
MSIPAKGAHADPAGGAGANRRDGSSPAGQDWSVRMADSIMRRHPLLSRRWHYEPGVALFGIQQVWLKTNAQIYFDFIKRNIDTFVEPTGDIRTYRLEDYNLDQINAGKLLFPLYAASGDARYRQAVYLLRKQLQAQPRNAEGGFWHKQIYPHQMWLDGIYMAAPFYAEFARTFDEPEAFDDVAHQIILIEAHTRDSKTGLLYHGWDQSRSQQWADPRTGCSPNFWGRAIGWYAMALPDVLDHFPVEHPKREAILSIFQKTICAVVAVQDEATGLWYQVPDQGGREGNYLEASAACMFVYAIAKGVRLGYLDAGYWDAARRAYAGILEHFIHVDDGGHVNLDGICAVGGLGGKPYRDGSFAYYTGERVVANDYKGLGAFTLASVEIELMRNHIPTRRKK